METRKEIAAEKKRCGSHNCTQAVVCTYYDYTGIDEDTLKNVGNAFAPCILPSAFIDWLVFPIVLPGILPHRLRRVGIL
jgi:hypothetical protein